MTRKLGSAALALSVLWAVISLVVKGGIGMNRAMAVFRPDFNLTSAQAEITHETANACLNDTFISCALLKPVPVGNGTNSTECIGPRCLLDGISTDSFDSDSYEILANVAILNQTEAATDLNQSIQFALVPGGCAGFNFTSPLPGTWTGFIPGASLHQTTNKNWTMLNFEGNIPTFTVGRGGFIPLLPTFDRLEFNFKTPAPGSTKTGTTLSLEGNADLCAISKGPMGLAINIADADGDNDFSCVTIPTPDYDTLDISSAVCNLPTFGGP